MSLFEIIFRGTVILCLSAGIVSFVMVIGLGCWVETLYNRISKLKKIVEALAMKSKDDAIMKELLKIH